MRQLLRSFAAVRVALFVAMFVAIAVAGAWSASPAAAVVHSAGARPFLLETVEFRGMPSGGWYDFPDKVAEALDLLSRCAGSPERCPNREVSELLAETATLSRREPYQILAAVNGLVNRSPYRSDLENFHTDEYWASPLEFLTFSGDCEDFAIFKYALLRHLGLPAESLRVVLLRRKSDGVGHAVLAAYLDDKVYILDSANPQVRPQSEVTSYTAVFSFNETSRWAHIATRPAVRRAAAPADSDSFLRLYHAVFSSTAPGPNEYRVQLGAFRSLENANRLWQEVWRGQWGLLGQMEPRIHSLDLGERGALHLLQIGAMASARQAEALCTALSRRGLECLVIGPGGQDGAAAS